MKTYNVIIIGSGPAGLFAAIWLEKMGLDKIAIIDRNSYPAGGLLNDGKLNFDYRVGFDIDELQIDRAAAEKMMQEIKQVLIRFPRCRQVTFIENNGKLSALAAQAAEQGAQFIAPEQWHWGTDNGKALVDYLRGQPQILPDARRSDLVHVQTKIVFGWHIFHSCKNHSQQQWQSNPF